MNNVSEIQKQIKAFNKQMQRAEVNEKIGNFYYKAITDLIDMDRMTSGGYAKAGSKYLESMSYADLMAYQADIKAAKDLLEISITTYQMDIDFAIDKKSALWQMYQKLEDSGLGFDSDQVHAVAEGDEDIGFKDMMKMMNKYLTDPNYGLSDFNKEWDRRKANSLKEG